MRTPSCSIRSAVALGLALFATSVPAQTVWIGTNGVSATTNWSDTLNWSTGLAPAASDAVKFYDAGAAGSSGTVNNVVDGAFAGLGGAIGTLQFGNTNGFHTALIQPGVTLTVNSGLNVGTGTDAGNEQAVTAIITGAGGALNLGAGNLDVHQGSAAGGHRATLDLSGLDTLTASIANLQVGVQGVTRPSGTLYLAKTNALTITGSLRVGNASADGTQTGNNFFLGRRNTINAANVEVGRRKGGVANVMRFNPAFLGDSPTAVFRGTDGSSPVSLWGIGAFQDGSPGSSNNSIGTNDFSGGTVDALVTTMLVGRGAQGNSASNLRGEGTLTFNAGTIAVATLNAGFQYSANAGTGGGSALGIVNVNGTGTLIVSDSLNLSFGLNPNTKGMLNVSGGTVWANQIISSNGTFSSISLSSGANVVVTNNLGGPTTGITTLSIADSTLTIPVFNGVPTSVVSNLTAGGANTINISAIPAVANYPVTFPLVKYTNSSGTFNFTFGTRPAATPAFAGYITNNPTTASLNLVLTNGPKTAQSLTWSGQVGNGDWDMFTGNWKTNGVLGAIYGDPDFVTFDDTAVSNIVNLTGTFQPSAVVVSNSVNYTFAGFGALSGIMSLTKQGNGTLTLANTGNNDFTGGLTVSGGTVRLGNGDASGSLGSGAVVNNGALVDNRNDDHDIANVISGGGTLTKIANGTLTLSAANAFTGAVTVAAGTLRPNNNAALGDTNGSTTIGNGASLDLNARNLGSELVLAGGAGVVSFGVTNGAIYNSGANQAQALRFLTVTSNTVLRADNRWDIRGTPGALLTSPPGSPYKLTKLGAHQFTIAAVTNVDSGLGDIEVEEGIFAVQGTTAQLGDPASNLVVRSGATLSLSNLNAAPLNKVITVADSATIMNEGGVSVISRPVTLQGGTTLSIAGTSLTFSNTLGGAGSLTKNGLGTVVLAGGGSYAGSTVVNEGKLVLNCVLSGGGTLTTYGGTTLAGHGTNTGPVDCSGTLQPGNAGVPGTFRTDGAMVFYGDVTFDLAPTNTTGGGVNDFLDVAGNLTLTGNPIAINVLQGTLQPGTYRLVHYGGALTGTFGGDPTAFGLYTFALDYTEPNWIKLTVTAGTPSSLTWFSTADSSWESAANWSNQVTAATVAFTQGDRVTFDDSVPGVQTNITLSGVVYPSGITNNANTNDFVIGGTGSIGGGGVLLKTGTNTLTLSTSNSFTGPVLINQGTLKLGAVAAANYALGATNSPAVVTNGATLDLNATGTNVRNLDGKVVVISGAGVGGSGAIINSGTRADSALQRVVMAGDATISAPNGRFDIHPVTPDPALASLSTGGQPFKLTKKGVGQFSLFSVTVDPALGDIEIAEGVMDFGDYTTGMGNPASNLVVDAGATLSFFANNPPGVTTNLWNKVFVLNGNGVANTVNNRGGGAHTLIGPMQLFGDVRINGAFTNRGNITGAGTLTRLGGGTLVLTGTNTYSGDTTVGAGTLALAESGTISNAAKITISSGATLNVAGRLDGALTLFSGQTLQGAGTLTGNLLAGAGSTVGPGTSLGRLNVSGDVTLQGVTLLEIDKGNVATNDQLFATGAITNGGTLVLSNVGPAYLAGDAFKLFNAASYMGSFTLSPATPGAGLAWDTSELATGGVLKVAAAPTPPSPTIQQIQFTGGNVILTGTNNAGPGGTYQVLTSTNVTLPLASWTVLTNASFDGSGNFAFTNSAGAEPKRFYLLQVP